MLQRNTCVKCYCGNQKPTVFQSKNFTKSNTIYVSLSEVRDLIDATKMSRHSDKEDLFESFGLDYEKCERNINDVTYLELCYHKSSSDVTISNMFLLASLSLILHMMRTIVS